MHMGPQTFFHGGQSRHFAYLLQFVGDATRMDVHKKCLMLWQQLHSVFPTRKFYTEKMFVLVRMDILRLS